MTGPTDESNVVPFPDDDIIPCVTGFPLVDADAKVIARRLGSLSWEDRAKFFHNIITECVEVLGKVLKHGPVEDKSAFNTLTATALISMHARIAETLELWGEEVPPDRHAAMVFALSMAPEHRQAARSFLAGAKKGCGRNDWLGVFEPGSGPMVMHNMSEIMRPGLSELWHLNKEGVWPLVEEASAS